ADRRGHVGSIDSRDLVHFLGSGSGELAGSLYSLFDGWNDERLLASVFNTVDGTRLVVEPIGTRHGRGASPPHLFLWRYSHLPNSGSTGSTGSCVYGLSGRYTGIGSGRHPPVNSTSGHRHDIDPSGGRCLGCVAGRLLDGVADVSRASNRFAARVSTGNSGAASFFQSAHRRPAGRTRRSC